MMLMHVVGEVEEIGRSGKEELSVEWRIRDVLPLDNDSNRYYASSEFRIHDEVFQLLLYLEVERSWVLTVCRRDAGPPESFHITVAMKGSRLKSRIEGKRLHILSGYSVHDFGALEYDDRYGPMDGVCTILCVLKRVVPVAARELVSTSPASTVSDSSVDLQQLSDEFSCLLKEETFEPDVTLKCGSRTWRAHRSILSVYSDVFAAMFRNRMVKRIHLKDLEPSILDSLLKYIYCGNVPEMSDEDVSALYEAADMYALHELRRTCSDRMEESLSCDNCLTFLVVANEHLDSDLKENIMLFVMTYFSQMKRAVWTNFAKGHSALAVEVLQQFAPPLKD